MGARPDATGLEQLADGAAVLARLPAACPDLSLLVTSREPLHLAGEQQYEVPVLEPEDAIDLFVSRARAVADGLGVDDNIVRSICERLDRLPLAIELAAATTKALLAAEILARLDKRVSLLAGGSPKAPTSAASPLGALTGCATVPSFPRARCLLDSWLALASAFDESDHPCAGSGVVGFPRARSRRPGRRNDRILASHRRRSGHASTTEPGCLDLLVGDEQVPGLVRAGTRFAGTG